MPYSDVMSVNRVVGTRLHVHLMISTSERQCHRDKMHLIQRSSGYPIVSLAVTDDVNYHKCCKSNLFCCRFKLPKICLFNGR